MSLLRPTAPTLTAPWNSPTRNRKRNRGDDVIKKDSMESLAGNDQGSDSPPRLDQEKKFSGSNHRQSRSSSCCGNRENQEKNMSYGTVFFLIAWLWHIRVLPFLYALAGREFMAKLALYPDMVETFQVEHGLKDQRTSREFAFMGAFTHTVVFMFGLVYASLLQRARKFVFRESEGPRKEPIEILASLALVLWTTAIFHSFAWRFLHFCFETKFEPVFHFARLFFREGNGCSPFAWTSSVSYSAALTLGLLFSSNEDWPGFTKISAPLDSIRSWINAVGLPFMIWILTLDKVTLPFLDAAHEASKDCRMPSLIETARGEFCLQKHDTLPESRSIAHTLGIAMCCIFPSVLISIREVSLTLFCEDGVPYAGFSNSLRSSVKAILKTFGVSFVVSSTLLTVSLYERFSFSSTWFALRSLCLIFTQAQFLLFYCSILIVGICSMLLLQVASNKTYPKTKARINDAIRLLFISMLWNCHLIGWWGSFLPFQIYAFVLRSQQNIDYSVKEAAKDGAAFVFCGSYIFPVVFQGGIKVFSAKMKIPWGLAQECMIAFMLIVPLSIMLNVYWTENRHALPIMLGMTMIHLLYILLTWRRRPELSGWRFWKELRLSPIWKLIQDYFDQQIIVEGSNINTRQNETKPTLVNWPKNRSNYDYDVRVDGPPVPRVIGFHPHGLFPCTLVWAHLTPRWRSVFGTLMPRPLTDAFIHTIPFMREFTQWAGGLEVSRPVIKQCLTKGETVILVPGGQGEILLHSSENMRLKRVVVCDRHKGFVRVAMEHGADLVPSFSFGELQAIQNISCPPLQRFTRRILGFPLPFFPVGRLGILPIPNPVKMTYVVGQPIVTSYSCKIKGQPTSEEVDTVHRFYFASLVEIFNSNKRDAGYEDWEICLSSDLLPKHK